MGHRQRSISYILQVHCINAFNTTGGVVMRMCTFWRAHIIVTWIFGFITKASCHQSVSPQLLWSLPSIRAFSSTQSYFTQTLTGGLKIFLNLLSPHVGSLSDHWRLLFNSTLQRHHPAQVSVSLWGSCFVQKETVVRCKSPQAMETIL